MIKPSILIVFAVLAMPTLAHATPLDTYQNYTFSANSTLSNKGGTPILGTISGNLTLDITNPLTTTSDTANFTALVGSANTPYTFTSGPTSITTQTATVNNATVTYYKAIYSGGVAATNFDLLFTLLNGILTLCDKSPTSPCGTTYNTFLATSPNEDEITGSLIASPVSSSLLPAPEPSSLLLLGTGILGIATATSRRLLKP